MTGVLIRLRSLRASLPEAEKAVANYVLGNSKKVPFQSVSELAEAGRVSIASVSRLSKRLGFAGFNNFKIAVAKESVENGIAAIYQAITPGDRPGNIIEKVFHGNIKSLEDTLKVISKRALSRAARCICKSPRTVFFGIGSSDNIAADAALRFALLDIQSESYSDPHEILVHALRMKKTEVAVGISHSGRSEITCQALECAKSGGAATVGISNYPNSPLHKLSDVFLCTAFSESKVKVAALSSRIAQMCVIDALYLLTAYFKRTFRNAARINDYVERYIRLQTK
ncbi:MAG: MurR/RpiR family transcriptional regulator [Planctomycetota bacterium]|jgi:DNA-binding MurR/RpiR family transcriptional regulator